ncbi:MAG TPA: hypothetical protein VE954_33355 [Oligoflexus sp.]|uniref:hypothetical protein n=1 Tax=Oligoflexus sp. TaxID=1971216 RepID=UPI002D2B6CD1|nr:hypothetical protein [Oligoflexus sp.]HYX38015.1 hypothetical protein [Oligoflexus sp.]
MRRLQLLGLALTLMCFVSCRLRDPIEPDASEDDPDVHVDSTAQAAMEGQVTDSLNMPAVANEAPIAMQTQVAQRVELLSFAHSLAFASRRIPTERPACNPVIPMPWVRNFSLPEAWMVVSS